VRLTLFHRSIQWLFIVIVLFAIAFAGAMLTSGGLAASLAMALMWLSIAGCVIAGWAVVACLTRRGPVRYAGPPSARLEWARIFAAFAVLFTILLFVSGIVAARTMSFLHRSSPQLATIKSMEESSQFGETLFRPTYVFITDDGRELQVASSNWVSPAPGAVGDQVVIRYGPMQPDRIQRDDLIARWLLPVIFAFLSITNSVMMGAVACTLHPRAGRA